MYTTQSETKSAYAERNIRSLKNIMYNHLEHKWTCHYKNKSNQFVDNSSWRQTKLLKTRTPFTISCCGKISKIDHKPRFQVGDTVWIAKQDLPFKKGYKQNFTDEISTIRRNATLNLPTLNLTNADGEIIQGKFHEPESTTIYGRV